MAKNNQTPKFVRVPESESPNKVFMTGEQGRPIADPEDLMKATGAETKEKAFEQVKDIGPDEARSMGVRLPGTSQIYGEQTETLTPEMLENIPAGETTPEEIEGGQGAAEPEETLGGGLDEARNTISDADDTVQDLGKRIQQLEKEIGEYAASQKEEAQEKRQSAISKLRDIATGTTRAEKREELETEAQLQKERKELQNIQNKIQKRKALLQKELARSEGRLEPMGFVRGEKAQMKAQAQGDIALLQAEAELEQGDVELAQQKIQRGLEDFEATKQRQTNFYNTLLSLHNQDVMRFENKELEALRQQKDAVVNAYDRQQTEMTNKWNAQVSVVEAGGDPIKNIESKSLQEVRQEAANKISEINQAATSGYGEETLDNYFSPSELRDIRREGIDPTTKEGFNKAVQFVENQEVGEGELSSTQLTKLADKGVSNSEAQNISANLNRGDSYDDIARYMINDHGYSPQEAEEKIKSYKQVVGKSGMTITTQTPDIEEEWTLPSDLKKQGKEEGGEESGEEGKGGWERFKNWWGGLK